MEKKDFATRNIKDFEGMTFRKVWDPFENNLDAMILISVRHTARSSHNTGIQRVVRGLAREVANDPRVRFVEWRNWKNAFFELMPKVSQGLGQFSGPILEKTPLLLPFPKNFNECMSWIGHAGMRRRVELLKHPLFMGKKGWLLLPELMTAEMMKEAVGYGKRMGIKVAVILYDCIAYFHPQWVNARIRENHRGYLHAMADADLVIAISETSGLEYCQFLKEENRKGAPVVAVPLAEQFLGVSRYTPIVNDFGSRKKTKVLYVSTLDPRKNHQRLFRVFQKIRMNRPELNVDLTIVGNRYDGAPEIALLAEELQKQEPSFTWREGVDDATLTSLYDETDFTVFPSLTEGYGLPIVESLWRGKPCLCSGLGSMQEIAKKGGCLTMDPFSEESIEQGLIKMIEDKELQKKLIQEIRDYDFKSWGKYSKEILEFLT